MATVTIGEGDIRRKFLIHKNLLAQCSPYFERAINGKFAESSGVITMSHHYPFAFEFVYQYLYGGNLMYAHEVKESKDFSKYYPELDDHEILWVRLLRLADETMITPLKLHAWQNLTRMYD